jgi:nucleotide-binding universal stress UspA family protein
MVTIDRILHPTDFSDNSKHSLDYACTLSERFEAELHLLYVVPDAMVVLAPPVSSFLPKGYAEDVKQSAESKLAGILNEKQAQNLKHVCKVVEGSAFLEILRYANDKEIDMIVMGTHGYSGLMHLLMGSVAENVVRKALCPVLTVHPEDHRFEMP